jgi:hypothetical protein
MNHTASSHLKYVSLWGRICRFLRALDEGLHIDETSMLAVRVTTIERELANLKQREEEYPIRNSRPRNTSMRAAP